MDDISYQSIPGESAQGCKCLLHHITNYFNYEREKLLRQAQPQELLAASETIALKPPEIPGEGMATYLQSNCSKARSTNEYGKRGSAFYWNLYSLNDLLDFSIIQIEIIFSESMPVYLYLFL